MTPGLFETTRGDLQLAEGAMLLDRFAPPEEAPLLAARDIVVVAAPFRHLVTPGGFTMSVAMTNCRATGWITDRRGYRYDALDPEGRCPWPAIPAAFDDLARRAAVAAGYGGFAPDACLINCYAPGARPSLHQDRNERNLTAQILSVSLGLPRRLSCSAACAAAIRSDGWGCGMATSWSGAARLGWPSTACCPWSRGSIRWLDADA